MAAERLVSLQAKRGVGSCCPRCRCTWLPTLGVGMEKWALDSGRGKIVARVTVYTRGSHVFRLSKSLVEESGAAAATEAAGKPKAISLLHSGTTVLWHRLTVFPFSFLFLVLFRLFFPPRRPLSPRLFVLFCIPPVEQAAKMPGETGKNG